MNFELKGRINSPEEAIEISEQLGAQFIWKREQCDQYFSAPAPFRVKIRYEDDGLPYLIIYNRLDKPGSRECEYALYKFTPESCSYITRTFFGNRKPYSNSIFVSPDASYCKTCCQLVNINRLEVINPREPDAQKLLENILNVGMHSSVKVKKTRILYMWENVRVHIDNVEDLGYFLEFEHPVREHNEQEVKNRLAFLADKFAITEEDTCEGSYSNMAFFSSSDN